jgi:hypothetical protein
MKDWLVGDAEERTSYLLHLFLNMGMGRMEELQ